MNEKPYFVILGTHHDGYVLPLCNDGDLAFFATYEEAAVAGQRNPLGGQYGYRIFDVTDDV